MTATQQKGAEASGNSPLEQRITIQSLPGKEGIEALDVLRVIAQTTFDGQLIVSPDFEGKFIAAIDDRPVREVLDAICRQVNCSWEVTSAGALKIVDSEPVTQL